MKTKQLIAAVAILAATGSVFAQQTEWVAADANFTPSKSRAEVVADLNQAYANGTLAQRDGEDTVILAGTRSRADVVAELNQAYADGTLIPRDGEADVMIAGTRSRDEVRAEATAANQSKFHRNGA